MQRYDECFGKMISLCFYAHYMGAVELKEEILRRMRWGFEQLCVPMNATLTTCLPPLTVPLSRCFSPRRSKDRSIISLPSLPPCPYTNTPPSAHQCISSYSSPWAPKPANLLLRPIRHCISVHNLTHHKRCATPPVHVMQVQDRTVSAYDIGTK